MKINYCLNCKRAFETPHYGRTLCSGTCRQEWHEKWLLENPQYRPKSALEKVCKHCGDVYKSRRNKYCSAGCAKEVQESQNKEWVKNKLRDDPEYRIQLNRYSNERHHAKYYSDPEYREKTLTKSALRTRVKRATDPIFREQQNQKGRDHRIFKKATDPTFLENQAKARRVWRLKHPEALKKSRERELARYARDKEYRDQIKHRKHLRYATDHEFRSRRQERCRELARRRLTVIDALVATGLFTDRGRTYHEQAEIIATAKQLGLITKGDLND